MQTALIFRWMLLASVFAVPIRAQAPAGGEDVFADGFNDLSMDGWYPGGGAWKVEDGMVRQTGENWGRHILFRRIHLAEGAIRFRARVDHPAAHAGNVFGVVLRYPPGGNHSVVRFGAYGATGLMQHPEDKTFARWAPELGRMYQVEITLRDGKVTVEVDGESLGTVAMADAKGPGYVGLYTEGAATFDDFELRGDWRADPRPEDVHPGPPRLEIEFAEWAPVVFDSGVPISVSGAVYAYVRNAGVGGARLENVSLGGIEVDPMTPPMWVPYVRMRPVRIEPGGVGQVEIVLNGLPASFGEKLMEDPASRLVVPVTLKPKGGESVSTEIDLAGAGLPLQINFMGFSEDLATLYLYIQNNRAMRHNHNGPATVSRIELNGEDVTPRARFGSRRIAADVVPVVIALERPLAEGQYARVVMETADGRRTGHVLRAFASRFNILIATSQMARTDFLEDIHNHCATALFRPYDRESFDALGFDLLPMRGPAFLTNAFYARKNPVVGMWIDEVDKPRGHPIDEKLITPMLAAEDYLAAEGEYLPLHCFNVCSPRNCALSGHLAAADAIMHSYGYHMCPATGRGFGRLADLPFREYRLSRRPFWPYFRDGEIVVLRNRETRETRRDERYQRVLTPKEARWVEFGTLLQGAKSFAHWGYWAYPKSGYYYIEEDCLRLGLGGPAGDRVGPYTLEPAVAAMLEGVWDEIGRINAEVQTIGPLVARSDVSHLARVAAVVPPTDPRGEPAAEAVALVSGLDTIIVLVLNHNIDTGRHPFGRMKALSNPDPPTYPPVSGVSVELRVPDWIKPTHVFSVDHEAIADADPTREPGLLRFRVPELEVSKIFVITSSHEVKDGCLTRHADMKQRLAKIAAHEPVYDENWSDANRN